jgi:hypothetical protein
MVVIVNLTSPSISRLAECGTTHHKRQVKLFAERKDVMNIVTYLDARG